MHFNKSIELFTLLFILILYSSCNNQENQTLRLWYEQPASEWMQATPAGNGRLGVMIYGGTDTETIALNEITLWSGQYDENQEIPCGKENLNKIRQLFFEGKIEEGNHLGSQFLSGRPNSFGTHLPIGDLKMNFNHQGEITNYQRELNIENSLTTIKYKVGNTNYLREYICSNPDDLFLIRLTADTENAINFELGLDLLRASDISLSGQTLSFSGQALFPKLGPGGVHYLGNIKVIADGNVSTGNNTLIVENSNEVLIAVDIRTDFNNPNYKEKCAETIRKASSKTYTELKKAHIEDYSRLFKRTEIYLGESDKNKLPTDTRWKLLRENGSDDPDLYSLFFQYGRYLLISSSRENSPLPANLQGVWNDNLACNMPWTCDYHLDINTEQNYWLTNVGNLHECNTPLFNYIEDLSDWGEKTAMKVYGSPGWTAHTVANVWGYTAPGQSVTWGLFPTAGAWMASHLWTHYCYTQDKEFLKNKAYPILKKSAEFFLDYMTEDPNSGYLMTGPSISPENSFKTDGREYALSMMPTCDRVLVFEALESCIAASEILDIDPEFRQSMSAALEKLPPIKIGKDGTIQEWFEDYELAHPNHRHSSHLLCLYPLHQITLDRTPELAEAAAKSVYRQLNSENWEDVEWSRANMICFYARLKNGEEAYKNLKGLLAEFSRENFFTMSPAGIASAESDIFSFDANEAGPAGIAEMLLQSHQGYIEFLPALPKEWHTGYFKGLCVRGGGEVDLSWDKNEITNIKLTASVDNTFSVKLPESPSNLKLYKNEKEIAYDKLNNIFTIELKKGENLELRIKS